MLYRNTIWSVFFFLTLFSCQKEKKQLIPSDVEPFLTAFFYEGEKRNFDIRLQDIDLVVEFTQLDNHLLGTCTARKNLIRLNSDFWAQADYEHKEWLVFHELGHCVLERPHKNDLFGNSECQSIMHGGRVDDFVCSIDLYSSYWRSYYLDELFDQKSELPTWFSENQEYYIDENKRTYLIDSILYDNFIEDSFICGGSDNFVVEIAFENWEGKTNAVGFSMDDISFFYCNSCTTRKLQIKHKDKLVYWNNELNSMEAKLSILVKNGLCAFFLNETFMHSFEFQQKTENRIRTIYSDEKINMNFQVYTF